MNNTFDLYGSLISDISEVKLLVEQALGVALLLRDSLFHGAYFSSYLDNRFGEYLLKDNIDLFDGEPVETDYPDYKVLLYVSNSADWSVVKERLTALDIGIVHLRHEVR